MSLVKFEMLSSISCDEQVQQEETQKAFMLMEQLIVAGKYCTGRITQERILVGGVKSLTAVLSL